MYQPRTNGLAERAVQTLKRASEAWSPIINVSIVAFLQEALTTPRDTKRRGDKTPFQLLGHRVRLPAIADVDLCEPILFKDRSYDFQHHEGLEHIFHRARKFNSDYSVELVSDNQAVRLGFGNVKTEQPREETIFQSKPQFQNAYVEPSHQVETSVATSTAEQ